MDISVIICTYGRGEQLRNVLVDLAGQDAISHVSFEVIVVDNNSKDNTKQVCAEIIARYPDLFRYVFEERQGKTFALNRGIKEAQGDILAFTDDDVVIGTRWVSAIKKAFAVNRDCRAFGGRVVPLWPDDLPPWIAREGAFKNTSGAIVEHDFGDVANSYPAAEWCMPCGANMFFGREIFEKYGGFNEHLNLGIKKIPMLEDVEFCGKLRKNGEKVLYIPDAVVSHPIFPERLTKRYLIKHAFKSGRAQYVIRNLKNEGQYKILDLQKNRRRLFNVPLYFAKNILEIVLSNVAVIWEKNQQMMLHSVNTLIYYFGIMYECFVQRKYKDSA